MKKSLILTITLAIYATASSGCWSSKASDGMDLSFDLGGQIVTLNAVPYPPHPHIINEKKYGGSYTEFSSQKLGPNEYLGFGHYAQDESDQVDTGIWHIKGEEILKIFIGNMGQFYQKGEKIFAYVNSSYTSEKYGIIFEVRRAESGEIDLHELFFVWGSVWKIVPISENKIQVVGYSYNSTGPTFAEVSIGTNQITTKYGKFVKSVPTMNEYYGIE